MEWWAVLSLLVFSLIGLMFIRVPVAFAFMAVNIVAAIFLWGQEKGLVQVVKSIDESLSNFALAPIPLFILMGEVMFRTGIAPKMIETVDKWVGRLPGRLSLLSVGAGTLLSTLTGSSVASTAMLGSTLLPEMIKKGYKKELSMGPIMASGTLAVMIPPSSLGVLLASIGKISIGKFMIAIIIPGILMAAIFSLYIIIRAKMNPELAPMYVMKPVPMAEKLKATMLYILPLGVIVFLVVGLIFLGIATPTQSAAMGVFGSMLLAASYGRLTIKNIFESVVETMKTSVMILMIVAGSAIFSQILSFSGASRNLVQFVGDLQLSAFVTILFMLFLIFLMGTFMESLSILMITLPIFIPIAQMLGIDLIWLATMLLIMVEFGTMSPPFGMGLFVMKGVAPKDTTMGDVYKAAFPFRSLDLVVVMLIMAFPGLTTWLPKLMSH